MIKFESNPIIRRYKDFMKPQISGEFRTIFKQEAKDWHLLHVWQNKELPPKQWKVRVVKNYILLHRMPMIHIATTIITKKGSSGRMFRNLRLLFL